VRKRLLSACYQYSIIGSVSFIFGTIQAEGERLNVTKDVTKADF